MAKKTAIKLFESKEIRTKWDAEQEEWFFSVVDVIAALTESPRPRKYWNDLKKQLDLEESELSANIGQLKLQSSDGKSYKTDVADTEQLFRLIQSIPSKKAEPFKLWLAKVGYERMNEIADPELAINRALHTYKTKGYSDAWINQRLKSIEIRKDLTDEWQRTGINKRTDFAILTNEITKTWTGKTVQEYKQFKNLKKENLRDNMSNMELVLNMLAEVTTKEISKKEDPTTFDASKEIAQEGGETAKVAKERIEKRLQEKVITSKNAKDLHLKKDYFLEDSPRTNASVYTS
jgi:hypothetical protein